MNDSAVQALTKPFHDTGLIVVAKGAKTMEDVCILHEQGMDRIHVFALARPMPIDKLIQFFSDQLQHL